MHARRSPHTPGQSQEGPPGPGVTCPQQGQPQGVSQQESRVMRTVEGAGAAWEAARGRRVDGAEELRVGESRGAHGKDKRRDSGPGALYRPASPMPG